MDMSHAESAYSSSKTNFDEWYARSEERWNRPMVKTQIALFLQSIPPEQREAFSSQIKLIESKLGLESKDGNAQIQQDIREKTNAEYRGPEDIQLPEPVWKPPDAQPEFPPG